MKTKISPVVFIFFLLLKLPCSLFAGCPAPSFNDSVILKIDFDYYSGFGRQDNFEQAKGYKFLALRVQIVNISESKQEVDLDEICLYDTINKRKYQLEYVMQTNRLIPDKKKYQTIKKGDYIYRRIVYSVPLNFTGSYVFYNNKLWAIDK